MDCICARFQVVVLFFAFYFLSLIKRRLFSRLPSSFSISIGALAAKTLRIYRLVKGSEKMKVIRISITQALPPMVFVLMVDVGLVIGMILSGDVSYDEIDLVVDQFGRATKREFRCNSKVIIYTLLNAKSTAT
jgi:hypothetical protein